MSAAPYIQVRQQYAQRKRENVRPHLQEVSAKSRRSVGSISSLEFVLAQAVMFVSVAAGAYGFSVLLGNSVAEMARRDNVRASERAHVAEADIVRLRDSINRLGNAEVVSDWAQVRGFVPAFGEGARPNATL